MRVLKNLLGDGSKIHVGEIQVSDLLNLMDSVIIEEGSNDDGNYIRFGNGLILCWARYLGVPRETNARLSGNWTYPVRFSRQPTSIGAKDGADLNHRINNATLGLSTTEDRLTTRLYTPNNDFVVNDIAYINVVAIGK